VETISILDGAEGGNNTTGIHHIMFEQVRDTSEKSNP
jgi:hypothetical protein